MPLYLFVTFSLFASNYRARIYNGYN